MIFSQEGTTRRLVAPAALIAGLVAGAVLSAPAIAAREGPLYEVTVTNATYGQQFTPFLLVTHESSIRLFEIGQPASAGLATLAETGDVAPLSAALDTEPEVNMTAAGAGLTDPGASVTLMIRGRPNRDRLSLAAMLIPTNDAFVALDAVQLPAHGSETHAVHAYDAGSEVNDELCDSIPGPAFVECGGQGGGGAPGNGEGFVHVHRGIYGVGDFTPADRAWQNPVAIVRVRRVN